MLKAISRQTVVRSSSIKHVDDGCIYDDVYTLEPSSVMDAWDCLSEDTFALEIARYPHVLHTAFISEMMKRTKHE